MNRGIPEPIAAKLVIRDDDVKLADVVWEAIKASAGAGLITGQFTWAAASAVAATFYKIGRALLKKKILNCRPSFFR